MVYSKYQRWYQRWCVLLLVNIKNLLHLLFQLYL